jgi:hypothetical protein
VLIWVSCTSTNLQTVSLYTEAVLYMSLKSIQDHCLPMGHWVTNQLVFVPAFSPKSLNIHHINSNNGSTASLKHPYLTQLWCDKLSENVLCISFTKHDIKLLAVTYPTSTVHTSYMTGTQIQCVWRVIMHLQKVLEVIPMSVYTDLHWIRQLNILPVLHFNHCLTL